MSDYVKLIMSCLQRDLLLDVGQCGQQNDILTMIGQDLHIVSLVVPFILQCFPNTAVFSKYFYVYTYNKNMLLSFRKDTEKINLHLCPPLGRVPFIFGPRDMTHYKQNLGMLWFALVFFFWKIHFGIWTQNDPKFQKKIVKISKK